MSNPNRTTDTEQFIANKEHNPSYRTKDVTPWVETTQGSAAQQVTGTASGSKVAMDTTPIDTSGATLVLTSGGQTGMKVMVVGDGDKYIAACTPYFNNALSTTVQTVKSSAGILMFAEFSNPNTVDAFIQIFDVSSVTLGTTTPTLSLLVPGGASSTLRGAQDKALAWPVNFATNIKIAATTTPTGLTAPSTAITVNLGYI